MSLGLQQGAYLPELGGSVVDTESLELTPVVVSVAAAAAAAARIDLRHE